MGGLCHQPLELAGIAGDPTSRIHRLDPRAKLLGLVAVTLVAVSTPIAAWPVYGACLLALAIVAVVARVPAAAVWHRARIVLPPILLVAVFVPFLRTGGEEHALGPLTVSDAGLATFGAVAAKATLGTLAAVLLAATTSFPDVLRGLEALRVPRLFILIAAFMYRYIFVVAGEVQRLRVGLAARAYRPTHVLQAGPLGHAATALFLRTYDRGERVHRAMLARGFDGAMPQLAPLRMRRVDLGFIGLLAGGLLALRIAVGVVA